MDYLIFWVTAGRGFVTTEGRRHDARTGDLYCLLKGEPHEYGSLRDDPWEVLWFHFDGRLVQALADQIRDGRGCRRSLGLDAALRERWLDLVVFHEARGPHFALRANAELFGLLGMIGHRLAVLRDGVTPAASADMQRLRKYVHDHLGERITVADMGAQVSLSVPHFTRVFRNAFGVSPVQYVMRTRIAQACEMLAETSMSLKQIGLAVGYPDPYYLSRAFKKVTGCSPSAYRKRMKESRHAL